MSLFKRVTPGMPIGKSPVETASWVNSVSQSAEFYLQQVASGRVLGLKPTVHRIVNPVKVKNLTGGNRVRGAVVQLGDYLLTTFDPRNPWFEGNTYDEGAKRTIAIIEKAATADEIVQVCIAGHCVARVNVSDTDHRFAAPDDGSHVLKSAASGSIEIISPVGSTGEQELFVVLGGGGSTMNVIHGQAVGAVSGSDFTIDHVELKNGVDPREDPEDDTETVEIENPFEWDIDDNGLVRAEQADDGTWVAVQAKCPG